MMKNSSNLLIMVPLVSFLAALRIFTEAQLCNNGLGRVAYEKITDVKVVSTPMSPEIIQKSGLPVKVLEECLKRCQEDKVTKIESCGGFDFKAGQRRSSPYPKFTQGNPYSQLPSMSADYEESQCTFFAASDNPDSNSMAHSELEPSWHFEEICLTSKHILTDCPNRWYVFERILGFKMNGLTDKELDVANRTECEDQCLNHTDLPCRSATFFKDTHKCILSRETRYINPTAFKADASAEYMENMCLKRSQMCSTAAFILEANKELDTSYEREVTSAFDFHECSNLCMNSLEQKGFMCRAFSFDDIGRTCILYDEDPIFYGEVGQDARNMNHRRPMKSSSGNLYRILCVNMDRDRSANSINGLHPAASTHGHSNGLPYLPPFNDIWRENSANLANPARSFGLGHDLRGQAPHLPPFGAYGAGSSNGYTSRHPGYAPYPDPQFGSNVLQFGASNSQGSAADIAGGPAGNSLPPGHAMKNIPPFPPPGAVPPVPHHGMMMPPLPPTYGIPYHSGAPQYPMHPNALGPGLPPFPAPSMMNQIEKCQMQASAFANAGVRFNRIGGLGVRIRSSYVTKVVRAERQEDCERTCIEAHDFICRSFNYRSFFPAENCELSQFDTKTLKLNNPAHFEQHTQFDYYERDALSGMVPGGYNNMLDCLEVSQTCTPDGMEFTVKTPEGFYGRIYTYGFYDSCFYDGNGGTVNVLRISRANGIPRCGTQQYGDAMTNIVVVQFNDYVQTSRDKKYNLTCYFSGPGEATVTSNYLDAKTDGRYPTQIEHLPAQNILTSNVVLRILYRNTPTNTIVVGDLLTFRLEAQGHYRYDYFNSDIRAFSVVAKDPYSGRQVPLIDDKGCPVDLYVFPELHKTPEGALEAEFYAFKIPDSAFLVFQAKVKTCRGPCDPVMCNEVGRGHGQFPSWGKRRRRDATGEDTSPFLEREDASSRKIREASDSSDAYFESPQALFQRKNSTAQVDNEEEVHELFRVFLSRADVPDNLDASGLTNPSNHHMDPESSLLVPNEKVCLSSSGYYTLVTSIVVSLLLSLAFAGVLAIKNGKRHPEHPLHHRT